MPPIWWLPCFSSYDHLSLRASTRTRIARGEQARKACLLQICSRFKTDLLELASEENNIPNLLMQDDEGAPQSIRARALVAFSFNLFKIKQSIVVAQLSLAVATASREHRCIADSHEILGEMFRHLSRYEEACKHFEEAHRCFKSLPGGADLARAGDCAMQLVGVWMYM